MDDNPEVAGKGIAKLEASGCNVTLGVLEAECKAHHKRFFTFHNKKRPYIILKWAQTRDGFIAPLTRDAQQPVWITNTYSRQLVHKWRSEEQAILVGTTTVLEDNPSLTVRDWTGQNPIRVVLDPSGKLTSDFNVFNSEAETIIIGSKSENDQAEVINWNLKDEIASQICSILHKKNINSVIIEGGTQTLQTFINESLWDEARVFKGSTTFKTGVHAPNLEGSLISESQLKTDTLKIYVKD
jgi:diaminohydroxyphosphoribosylaminopyrimidine deaminase/5-amino-6-(5-phosphoribosylamino)uracil reductase